VGSGESSLDQLDVLGLEYCSLVESTKNVCKNTDEDIKYQISDQSKVCQSFDESMVDSCNNDSTSCI
jgi:hypothetical protein